MIDGAPGTNVLLVLLVRCTGRVELLLAGWKGFKNPDVYSEESPSRLVP
jgi:hypothetical protein